MGCAVNGLALHGDLVSPYESMFLVFIDYMRSAIRLTALMNLSVAWVFTHDSVGLGEDGPTHQPIEHCMTLRAIPGLTVIRLADANETATAWHLTLQTDGPVALLLARQNVPMLDLESARSALRGVYVYADPNEGAPELVLSTP